MSSRIKEAAESQATHSKAVPSHAAQEQQERFETSALKVQFVHEQLQHLGQEVANAGKSSTQS